MAKSELSGLTQTVLGTVDPSTLGMTTTHEHIFIDFACMYTPTTEASTKHLGEEPVSMENLGWVRYDPFLEDAIHVGTSALAGYLWWKHFFH